MNYLPIVIVAFLLNAVAITIDKILLTEKIPNPKIYIFYISLFSLLSLFLIPFTHLPTLEVFILASFSTLLWTAGAYSMFSAIKIGPISRVIPVIGVLTPLILLLQTALFNPLKTEEVIAILLLVSGLLILTLPDWRGTFSKKELLLEFLAALFFAISYLVLKEAYLKEQFLTVFTYSRMILIPIGAAILFSPKLKTMVLSQNNKPKINFLSKSGMLFLLGQLAGGSSQLLILFSIALATPALVNSLQGVQYIFLFIFSLFLARTYPDIFNETFTKKTLPLKVIGIVFIGVGLLLLSNNS